MNNMVRCISLDVGEKRIGVAIGDSQVKLATPLVTIAVDGSEIDEIKQIISNRNIDRVIVGYPRNQSGEPTKQSEVSVEFAKRLEDVVDVEIIMQDESLTSVMARQHLNNRNKPYEKSDVDMEAASIILQDYLEGIK